MMRLIDNFLNRITMYRLVEYILIAYLLLATVFSFTGTLAFSGWSVIGSTIIVVFVCWLTNIIFAGVFNAPRHNPSAIITALILALIIPPHPVDIVFLFWAGVLAIASKYIVAWRAQHLLNPVAVGVALTAIGLRLSATWWVGNAAMWPIVLVGGLLIIRKTKKFDVFWSFVIPAAVVSLGLTLLRHASFTTALRETLVLSPILFFGTVMLSEPATMPGTKRWRMAFGLLVGLLFSPQIHFGKLYLTPELALLIGNVIFFLLRPRRRYTLRLIKQVEVGGGVIDFIFRPDRPLNFRAGQFVELTLAHAKPDKRGLRRYFTIASAPGERDVRFGVKFYRQPSTFKQALRALRPGSEVVASQLGGDFTLPSQPQLPCVFIAGGIGVTPFRSMISSLLATNQARDITLFYSVPSPAELAYDDVFEQARAEIGLNTVYTLTDPTKVPARWVGRQGFIDPPMIAAEVPDYQQRLFYISGPNSMVDHFKSVLRSMGIAPQHIKTDFFPGFA